MQNLYFVSHPASKPCQWKLVYWSEFQPVRGKFKGQMIRRRYTLRCHADQGYRLFMRLRARRDAGTYPYIIDIELWRSGQRVL